MNTIHNTVFIYKLQNTYHWHWPRLIIITTRAACQATEGNDNRGAEGNVEGMSLCPADEV